MAKEKQTFKEIMELAERYGVQDNPIFLSAAKRYQGQLEMIEAIRQDIQNRGLMITHTNVAGKQNTEANPLAAQLPRHQDVANKTLGLMISIIGRLGESSDDEDSYFDVN